MLGKGAMGIVYRAHDTLLDRTIAVKTCYEDVAASTKGRNRFEREVKAAGRLHHPNIVVVFDGGMEGDTPFIAMELVNGPTLGAELERRGKIPPEETARLIRKIAEGLEYAHRHGVVHRDLKPANILLTPDGQPKISDFGVAKLLSADSGVTETPVGTPRNMSPEQVSGSAIDGRSDVFALGILAYELLTGVSPFAGEHFTAVVYNILNNDPMPPSRVNPELPPAVDAPILRALTKDRDHRTTDPLALADELDRAIGVRAPAGATAATVAPKRKAPRGAASDLELGASDMEAFRALAPEKRQPSRGGPFIVAIIGGVLLLLLLVWWLAGGDDDDETPIIAMTPTEEPAPTATAEPTRRPTSRPTPRPVPTKAVEPTVEDVPVLAAPSPRPTSRPAPTSTRAPVPTRTAVPTAEPRPTQAPTAPPPPPTEVPVPAQSALDVISQPLGAEIVVDGTSRGRTPMRVSDLPPGPHDVEIRKDGFLPYRQRVNLEADSRYELNVKLASEVNSMRVVSDPPGARVRLDGSEKGATPLTIDSLPNGTYTVEVTWGEGRTDSRKVELAGGELTEVRFRMEVRDGPASP